MTRWPLLLRDTMFALPIALLMIPGTFGPAVMGHEMPPEPVMFALPVMAAATLSLRRSWPVPTLVIVMAIVSIWTAIYGVPSAIFMTAAIAIYTSVVSGHRRVAWGAAPVFYLALLWSFANTGLWSLTEMSPGNWTIAAVLTAWPPLLVSIGEMVRIRRERRAERVRLAEEEELRQKSEERLLIARELHDVLGHNISLINVQAGVALHLIEQQPERARTALATIKEASKEVLDEMRSALAVLREEAPRTPTAGLDRLPSLVEKSPLDVSVTGDAGDLPAGADLAAFRIIQEALTNVTKHSKAQAAAVRLARENDRLEITVEDPGPARDEALVPSGGSGIGGMRARARALGGKLEAGPHGGGFRVSAVLPVEAT